MTIEANTGLGVNAQYGARGVDGAVGEEPGQGHTHVLTFQYGADNLIINPSIPANSQVTDINTQFLTAGALSAATVGAVDVFGALSSAVGNEDEVGDAVATPLGGVVALTVNAAARGTIHLTYRSVPQAGA